MKSQSSALLHVVDGLLKDVHLAYPAYRGYARDFSRLTLLTKTRGLGVFTLDLPHLDSILVDGLKTGLLKCDGPLTKEVSHRIRVPRLFSGLWLRVFDKNACLRSDADPNAVLFLRQLCCIGKKLEVGCSVARIKATVGEYHAIESRSRQPSLTWAGDDIGSHTDPLSLHLCDGLDVSMPLLEGLQSGTDVLAYSSDERRRLATLSSTLQRLADEFSQSLEWLDPLLYSEQEIAADRGPGLRHGPGAVADPLRNHNKYDFPSWPAKLGRVFPFDYFGTFASNRGKTHPSHMEYPSKLLAVPKTAKSPRLIASEPTCYQWTQQLVRQWLEEQIPYVYGGKIIDFRNQERSRYLAIQASRTGDLATVDLSSASDRLTCWVVERIFRKNYSVLSALHATRCRWTVDSVSGSPAYFIKKKFASQGTAVTFPVQTIIFSLCALACLPGKDLQDRIRRYGNKVQVFGDDIILPSHGYDSLRLLLTWLGLQVNDQKSFHTGNFRESCGSDAFMGYDVTPCKPKVLSGDKPESITALVDISNNLFLKGFWNAALAVESMIPRYVRKNLATTGIGSGLVGLTSYSGTDISNLRCRWNDKYQRYEVKTWSPRNSPKWSESDGTSRMMKFLTSFLPRRSIDSRPYEGKFLLRSKTSNSLRWEPKDSYQLC